MPVVREAEASSQPADRLVNESYGVAMELSKGALGHVGRDEWMPIAIPPHPGPERHLRKGTGSQQ